MKKYLHYQCKVTPEHFIRVAISAKAEVLLLDTLNFYRYQSGKTFEAASTYTDVSEIEIKVPYKSTWHVIIPQTIYPRLIRANVKVV